MTVFKYRKNKYLVYIIILLLGLCVFIVYENIALKMTWYLLQENPTRCRNSWEQQTLFHK